MELTLLWYLWCVLGVALLHYYSVTHGRLVITILLLHDLAFLLLGDGLAALGLELLMTSENRANVKCYLDSHNAHLISPAQ